MHPVRQSAIVLGGVNYSDSSRVVWILTPEYGRQSLMVKGARRPKSKYLGSLETFNLVRVIYRKISSKSIYTLRDVDVEDHFSGIRQSLDAFLAASHAVELAKIVSEEEQESEDLFGLLKSFLTFAGSLSEDAGLLNALLAAFRWRTAGILGIAPRLVACIRCGRKLTRVERYRFLPAEGGVLCSECEPPAAKPGGGDRTVSGARLSYQALRFIYRCSRAFPSSTGELIPLSAGDFADVERLSRRFLACHLGDYPVFSEDKKCWPA